MPAELRRNRLQEQLLGVSNVRCSLFKSLLYEFRSKTNLLLGTLSTATGVVGGIVTGAGASRALSGASGIFSGTRAEFNQEMFQNLATQVIIEGIDVRRREVYDQIVRKGQALTIQKYSMEAAVKDAIFYHAQCNVVTGFQMAQDSIKTYADPGIDAANRVLAKLRSTRELLQNRNLTPEQAATLLSNSNSILGLAGKPEEGTPDPDLLISVLYDAKAAVKLATASFIGSLTKSLSAEDKAALSKLASDARNAAEGHLDACQKLAVEKSTELLKARADAAPLGSDQDENLKNRTAFENAKLEAGKITKDINTLLALTNLHYAGARVALAKLEDEKDEAKAAGAVKTASEEIKKPVAAGVCKEK